jgi:hypothetical protein
VFRSSATPTLATTMMRTCFMASTPA